MAEERLPSKFAFILHADVAGSTTLVQQDEALAHKRIQATFRRFDDIITHYHGQVRELRGDALAEFERASDAKTVSTEGASKIEVEGATSIDIEEAKALFDRNVPFIDVSKPWYQEHIRGSWFLMI